MPTPKQQYIKTLNEIAARYGRMEDETIRRSLALLKDLRAQVAAELSGVEGWEAYRLTQLQQNLDRLVADYQAQLSAQVRAAFAQSVQDGAASVVEPLQRLGVQGAFFRPSPAQVNVLLDFSAELVRGIADQVRDEINKQIRLAALGDQVPLSAMRGITQALGIDARVGVWAKRKPLVKGVAARAETILRTEMQRAYNLAHHSQQRQTGEQVPGLTKSWIATADSRTRESHLRAHHQYRDNPIPVGEAFVLRDKQGKAELMYPGDPQAPARFTINCRCRMATHHPGIGAIGSSLDGRIEKELKRRSGGTE